MQNMGDKIERHHGNLMKTIVIMAEPPPSNAF
jgi:hypothetical protein